MPVKKTTTTVKKTVKKEAPAPEMKQKLRIKLKAYDHKIIDIVAPNAEIIEALRDLNLPSGVDITVKI